MNLCTLAEEFVIFLDNVRNFSPRTIRNYSSDLRIFCDYCTDELNITNAEDLTDNHIIKFLGFTKKVLHNSSYATARKLRCLRSLFRYALERHYLDSNPTESIREPKIEKRLPIYLTLDEARTMLQVVDGKFKERDYAMIMVFLFGGLRVSELSGINIGDFNLNEETLTVIGKGNKERMIPLNDAVVAAIRQYQQVRPLSPSPALFLSYRKERITDRGIQKIIKKYAELAGITKKITPHKLRHTCATLLYNEGSLLELKQLLGHESVATTQIYAHTNAEQLKKLAKSNPLLDKLKN